MKPLIWGAVAGAVVMGVLLVTRKSTAAPLLPSTPAPEKNYGETTRVALAVPTGWRRITSDEVLPELVSRANTLRSTIGFTSMQYGTLAPFVASDGRTYATWVEQHFHPIGGTAQPWGFHHGVTLLARS